MRACWIPWLVSACTAPVAAPVATPAPPIPTIEKEPVDSQELPAAAIEPGHGWFCHMTPVLGILDCDRSVEQCNKDRDLGMSVLMKDGASASRAEGVLGPCAQAAPWCYTSFDGGLDCAADEKTCNEMRDVSGNESDCTQPP